jgi:5-oxopent-3-ene-1,2,5-tricarboxylate decarboxylase / 2-hydroxyhepta-2,4-diene-1,7-dioate isomerase
MRADAGYFSIPFDVPPHRLSGAVYGALLNHRSALADLGESVNQPPYKAPPVAPVLYIKPRNTLGLSGDVVRIPAGTPDLEVGACVGVVIGRTACRISESRALDYVAGYLIVADVSIPHANYHRPCVRFKARDGFCPLGPSVTARAAVADPDALTVRMYLDGVLVQTANTADLIRPAARLLADVTEFMTLAPGDVLALGAAGPAPRAPGRPRPSASTAWAP